MSTQFKPTTATASGMNASLMQLPILKHFDQDAIMKNVNSFKKGEKNVFWFLKLAVLIGLGYLTWTKVITPAFQMLGMVSAYILSGVAILFFILMLPVIFKVLRRLVRYFHKLVINADPFAELADQRVKMVNNQTVFRQSKGSIDNLQHDMQVEAKNSETEANQLETKILSFKTKADVIKEEMNKMLATGGAKARESDEYVNANNDLLKILSESNRAVNKFNQAKAFISKYGTRAAIMKKLSQKLSMVETTMEIKIADFDTSVEMLKKDYEFAQKSRMATDAAKSAMLFTKSWELDYAMEVVTSTIASDIAMTAGNIRDIDSITNTYGMDSDELYANLDRIADGITSGVEVVPSAKAYNNPEYKLTSDDKLNSGGFKDLF